MKATEILMQEHRVIERVLTALETAANRAEAQEPIRPSFFTDAADFIRNFADGCHHQKEEGVLFKAMEAAGMPSDDGPIAVMLSEHEQGRAHTRAMADAAAKWDAGDDEARRTTVTAARAYAALLREHILKEDSVLFPMAAHTIPQGKHASVSEDVERVERTEAETGAHRKYRELAATLEAEVRL
jgi:hemerythrin-like domain-containing protein